MNEAVPYTWKVGGVLRFIFIVVHFRGLVVGVFRPYAWLEGTPKYFPGRLPAPGRWGSHGVVAERAIYDANFGTRVPAQYRKPGAQDPVRYCEPV